MRKILASALVLLVFTSIVREVCAASDQMGEPFGLDEFVAPENSPTWQQWKKIIADAQAELRKLERCRTGSNTCNAAEWRFAAIVREARAKDGRAKIEFVNGLINGVIRYQPDQAHWGIPDAWSLPVDTGNDGSLNTGVGDCEDFVLAKYSVLHQAGVPDEDLRIVLLHDNAVRQDHAVLAVRHDQQWLILDNRWNNLFKDKDEELRQFKPLMIVTRNGVWILSKMFRIGDAVSSSEAIRNSLHR
jgi:predicted transglutaminase-like cysteine proteinase